MNSILIKKKIENQFVVWYSTTNNYSIVSNETLEVISLLNQNKSIDDISSLLSKKLSVTTEELKPIIETINTDVFYPNIKTQNTSINTKKLSNKQEYPFTVFYKINNVIFKIEFQSDEAKFWVHPKFSHLEIEPQKNFNEHFQVISENGITSLYVNEKFIGTWTRDDIHYFQGKFSMELVQSIHKKNEEQWMGVFHASAVSNGKQSMLFLGESGNGKSTSLALLQASGFTCIADDFVPVDIEKEEVFSFPSAISIKKNSIPVLKKLYPELESSTEYHLDFLNKVVRYLPPKNSDYTQHLPCKGLVFIKYNPDVELEIIKISKIEAFKNLVPDSWLSPIKENAETFLNWFLKLPCYQLTYANNKKMIATVTKLFDDEL